MPTSDAWTIDGAAGEVIVGDTHLPDGDPRGVVIIAHGFKGYKDYGMFPAIATACVEAGLLAHRFNFSHSGMTNDIETFARPQLFERDTWTKQVTDLRAVVAAIAAGVLPGGRLPYVLFGHSRGGVSVLLTAGRFADDPGFHQPAGVATASAPCVCNPMSPEDTALLERQGYLESPSSRTGQVLRIGRAFLQEQLDDPAGHDLAALVAAIRCPILVIHGETDPTVPAVCADILAAAATRDVEKRLIAGADHVFNTPNPMPASRPPGPQLQELLGTLTAFALRCCSPVRSP